MMLSRCSRELTWLVCWLALVVPASAHMELFKPLPIRSQYSSQTAEADKDYSYTSPLEKDGSNWPCKGYATQDAIDKLNPEATLTSGEDFSWDLKGTATHNGGSCQVSISYDAMKTQAVMASWIGGCPLSKPYTFKVPDLPSASKALFVWSWVNESGNRELYQNCAVVEVKGSADSYTGPAPYRANTFSDGTCKNVEGVDDVFPNPGQQVFYGGKMSSSSPATTLDNCSWNNDEQVTVTSSGGSAAGGSSNSESGSSSTSGTSASGGASSKPSSSSSSPSGTATSGSSQSAASSPNAGAGGGSATKSNSAPSNAASAGHGSPATSPTSQASSASFDLASLGLPFSVLFETSVGDIVVDLDTELCPKTCTNFLKLCKIYKYNFCCFHNVLKDFIAQTGASDDSGNGGPCVWHLLPKSSKDYSPHDFFVPETFPKVKHVATGTLSMAVAGQDDNRGAGSQFFFTLADNLTYLDGKHAPFGKVVEGLETLEKINEALVDQDGRPLRDIRIRHVIVLEDPFPDPEGLDVPPESPTPTPAQLASLRVGDEEELEDPNADPEEVEKARREREARAQALTLEMVGDLPFADVAPPENVLFVCKLNSVTRSEDLELIFSRFGKILSCEIICDQKTGDSLQYAFIEFENKEDAERAYLKMDNVLIDDRRIHVDFSQSVTKLHNSWVYNKTGGRPPPNKHGGNRVPSMGNGKRSRRSSSPPSAPTPRPEGRGRDDRNLVFDLGEYDSRRDDRRRDDRGHHSRRDDGYDSHRRRDNDHRRDGRRDDHYERRRSRSPPRRSRY